VTLPLLAATVVGVVVGGASLIHPIVGAGIAVFVLFSSTSLRLLCSIGRDVISLSETDLPRARDELKALAGRDATELSSAHVRSAAVESVAENLADGLVAPLSAFGVTAVALSLSGGSLIGGSVSALSLATAAAAWVKAVNTMDSMVGYHSNPMGWASARLDDLVMWVPARLTAVLISVAAGSPDPLLRGRRWARIPASPNAGWPMATLAAALTVQLDKPETYCLNPMASLPTVREAERGVDIVGRAGWLAFCTLAVIVLG
jgi:adenosylcobinamide-phosphate synthase